MLQPVDLALRLIFIWLSAEYLLYLRQNGQRQTSLNDSRENFCAVKYRERVKCKGNSECVFLIGMLCCKKANNLSWKWIYFFLPVQTLCLDSARLLTRSPSSTRCQYKSCTDSRKSSKTWWCKVSFFHSDSRFYLLSKSERQTGRKLTYLFPCRRSDLEGRRHPGDHWPRVESHSYCQRFLQTSWEVAQTVRKFTAFPLTSPAQNNTIQQEVQREQSKKSHFQTSGPQSTEGSGARGSSWSRDDAAVCGLHDPRPLPILRPHADAPAGSLHLPSGRKSTQALSHCCGKKKMGWLNILY